MLNRILGWFSNDLAIDLGTANTLVYAKGKGIVVSEPSVVAVTKNGRGPDKVRAVGREAKEMVGRTPGNIVAIRPMKDGVIADFEIAEAMLRYFIMRVHNRSKLVRPRIVVAVPSGITEVEKRAVRDSAKHAGAREVFLVAEPMAAAIGVGLPVDQPSGNMIIDIGGGTSEIAVIALNGIVCDTSIRVGGDELDEAIVNYVKKNHNLLIGDQTAENIKKTIGSAHKFDEEREMEVKGLYQVSGVPKTIKVSSVEIREALQEPIQQICDALKHSLEQTPPELAADIKDRGIVLTGGGALLRGLPELLREQTDLPINLMDDPLFCVVLGTGKILDDFEKYRPVIMPSGRT